MTKTEKISAYCALAITLFFLSFFGAREWYAYEKRVQAKESQIQAEKDAEERARVEQVRQKTIRSYEMQQERKEKENSAQGPVSSYNGIDTYDVAARMWATGRGMYEKLEPEADRATLRRQSDGTYYATLPVSVKNGYGDYIMATLTATVSADGSRVYDIFLE